MSHSIEGRVPFLDLKMIELGQRIPAKLKLVGSPVTEKWILRKTFEDLLPEQIVWRVKEQFDEGSGTVDLLSEMLASAIDPEQAQGYARQHPDANLRSPEECYYHQIFMDVFDRPEPILDNVARWSERPL
jgi:asparagine synthase (glutamine-hydrolysing)